jgi:hypothetical protein
VKIACVDEVRGVFADTARAADSARAGKLY